MSALLTDNVTCSLNCNYSVEKKYERTRKRGRNLLLIVQTVLLITLTG